MVPYPFAHAFCLLGFPTQEKHGHRSFSCKALRRQSPRHETGAADGACVVTHVSRVVAVRRTVLVPQPRRLWGAAVHGAAAANNRHSARRPRRHRHGRPHAARLRHGGHRHARPHAAARGVAHRRAARRSKTWTALVGFVSRRQRQRHAPAHAYAATGALQPVIITKKDKQPVRIHNKYIKRPLLYIRFDGVPLIPKRRRFPFFVLVLHSDIRP